MIKSTDFNSGRDLIIMERTHFYVFQLFLFFIFSSLTYAVYYLTNLYNELVNEINQLKSIITEIQNQNKILNQILVQSNNSESTPTGVNLTPFFF